MTHVTETIAMSFQSGAVDTDSVILHAMKRALETGKTVILTREHAHEPKQWTISTRDWFAHVITNSSKPIQPPAR